MFILVYLSSSIVLTQFETKIEILKTSKASDIRSAVTQIRNFAILTYDLAVTSCELLKPLILAIQE